MRVRKNSSINILWKNVVREQIVYVRRKNVYIAYMRESLAHDLYGLKENILKILSSEFVLGEKFFFFSVGSTIWNAGN